MVRPWKAPSMAMMIGRDPPPARRAILKAASLASVPELEKNTAEPLGRSRTSWSFSASAICGGEVKKFEMWPRVDACSVMALTQAGWQWPSALTAMPASRSRYSLPEASHACTPAPRTRSSWGEPKTGERTREKSSRQVWAWSVTAFVSFIVRLLSACLVSLALVSVTQRCGFDDGVFDHGADALGGEDLEEQ